jgi:NADH:ubiquinone oxidoreductase subunit 5 (subunit L)/multisubunit Na+/H+ antiporter MnhA subunit
MIKTGIYGILRTLLLIGIPSKGISYFVLLIAIISGLYGVLYAITQHDLKRLLAYHSIENIGIIGIGIGIGMIGLAYQNSTMAFLGLSGGILHILNHSIFKPLLFLCAGNVYLKTHTRNIEFLGGLIKTMPMTAILFIIGSIAICGLPPFNGFISEFLIYIGIINGLTINKFFTIIMIILALSGLALIGTMAILCFSKATGIIFLGTPKTENSANVKEDVEFSMILPIIVFAIFALLIGLFPQYILIIINKTTSLFIGAQKINFSIITDLMKIISRFSLIFITFVGILVFIKYKIQKSKITAFETWGCGYDKPSSKMQYTASSYAKPFVIVLRPLFKKVFDVVKPKKLFPKEAHYHSHIDDIEEAYFINPLVKFDEHILSKFEKLQDGNIQTYIKYGMGFLIIILIVCLFIS